MKEQILTHKGWFGLCPVYIGDVDSEGPFIEPRYSWLMWLLLLSGYLYQAIMAAADAVGGRAPGFPIRVTGQLKTPITIKFEEQK